jgi:hypothetical protein
MATTTSPAPAAGNHSAQWGLSAILLSMLIVMLFPIIVMSMFASMVGAATSEPLESRDIDLGVAATYIAAIGLLVLAAFALLFSLFGLLAALIRRQAPGLSVAGFVVAALALALAIVQLIIALRCIEWTRGYQQDRFGPGRHQHVQPPPFVVPR